ncbi:IstB-like ATP binding protein [Geobacter argillaceus]|uniref:IstB-like ATP binding protein n=1 Tax=Geobacter argillaceus TaxID=345631 RepID=A0A562WQ95_9BACT|nr:IstB-like ATP binding protein [Geobacter argillaceus]
MLYQRLPKLLREIAVSRHDGRYHKLMAPVVKCEVLILDDLLISPISREDQRELLEVVPHGPIRTIPFLRQAVFRQRIIPTDCMVITTSFFWFSTSTEMPTMPLSGFDLERRAS